MAYTTDFNKPFNCPVCGVEHDAATSAFDEYSKPRPGDWTVCVNCASPSVYAVDDTGHIMLRGLTEKDMQHAALKDPEAIAALNQTIAAAIKVKRDHDRKE